MLHEAIGRRFSWVLGKIVAALAATSIPPLAFTWLSLFLQLWAGVLFAAGRFAMAGVTMILAGFCDLVDGPLAAPAGRAAQFGTFLDSILDRYADLVLFLGLLVYYARVNRFLYAVLVGAAMAAAVMVSYARARAESLVGSCHVGFWERPERLVLMIVGALTNRMEFALWILAIGPNLTVVHRILHTWRRTEGGRREQAQSKAAEPAASGAAPAAPLHRSAHQGG